MKSAKTEVAVAVHDLTLFYRKNPEAAVVSGLSFEVKPGHALAVLGPSGSGKSSLLAFLAQAADGAASGSKLPTAASGSARVLGRSLGSPSRSDMNYLSARVGYLSQNSGMRLTPNLTVAENLAEPILRRDKRWDRDDINDRVSRSLELFDLKQGLFSRYPHELSSGQRQRAALAKSLMLEPRVWIADDPGRGIDILQKERVVAAINELTLNTNTAIIFTSSDLEMINDIADRVVSLSPAGELSEQLSVENISLARPGGYLQQLRELSPVQNN